MKKEKRILWERIVLPNNPEIQETDDLYIIPGVKILGASSKNDRDYSPIIKQSAHYYEGIKLRKNHPKKGEGNINRDVEDTFGWLKECEDTDTGPTGKAHLLKSDPFSLKMVQAARNNPSLFGMSHNAEGEGYVDRKSGRFVVESLTKVHAVECVDGPATTKSLYEQTGYNMTTKPKTRRQVIKESELPRKVKRLLWEMDDDYDIGMDAPVIAPPTEPDESGELPEEGDVGSMIGKMASLLAQNADPKAHTFLEKILTDFRQYMDTGDSDNGSGEGEGDTGSGEGDNGNQGDDDEKPVTEAIAIELCRLGGVRAGKALLESLQSSKSIQNATSLVAEFKANSQQGRRDIPSSGGKRPVKQAVTESEEEAEFPKGETLAEALTQEAYSK